MKNILLIVIAIVGIYFAFLRGPGYSIDVSGFDGSISFNHKEYGYQLQLPKFYYESDDRSPVRSNYFDSVAYFKSEKHAANHFVIGVVDEDYMGNMRKGLKQYEAGAIDEADLFSQVRDNGGKKKAFIVDGIPVYQSTRESSRTDNSMVTILVNDTLIQFAVVAPKNKEKEVSKIIRSMRRI